MATGKKEDLIYKEIEELLNKKSNSNLFSILSLETKELIHSRFIAFLLAKNGQLEESSGGNSHRYGNVFLNLFIKKVLCWDKELTDSKVHIEYSFSEKNYEGRFDIFIEAKVGGDKYGLVIENKINASDQEEQLLRYYNWLENNYGENRDLIYLTLDGRDASQYSTKGEIKPYEDGEGDYHKISYTQIIDWMKDCKKQINQDDDLKLIINNYIDIIENINSSFIIAQKIIKNNAIESIEKFANNENQKIRTAINQVLDAYLYSYYFENSIRNNLLKIINKKTDEIYFEDNICYIYFSDLSGRKYEYDIMFTFSDGKVSYYPICIESRKKSKKWYCGNIIDSKISAWIPWSERNKLSHNSLSLQQFINDCGKDDFKNKINKLKNNIKESLKN